MGKVKALLKKNPFFYSIHGVLQRIKAELIILFLKTIGNSIKQTCDISVSRAMQHISAIRSEKIFKCIDDNVKIDSSIDLSIIVPVYNAERYLKRCLNSIRNQKTSYKYQVICINDGSTDESSKILENYADDHKFLIYNQDNKGHSGARNRALDFPMGKYLMFVDSDDFISENYVDSLLKKAYETSAEVVQSNCCKCNAEEKILEEYSYKDKVYTRYADFRCFGGVPWGRIYKSCLWDGVRFPEGMMFEDTIILNVVLRRCKCASVSTEAKYFYRIYGNNTLNKLQGDPRILDAVWSVKYSLELASSLGINNSFEHYTFLLWQCSRHVYYRIKHFSIETQKMCFIVMCNLVSMYKDKMIDDGQLKDVLLLELDKCFAERNFFKWKICSKIYKR